MPASLIQTRGSALLSALFIMTLVAIAATAMSTRVQLDIYRIRLTMNADKLYLASQGVSFWAMATIADREKKLIKSDRDGKLLSFPEKLQHSYPDVLSQGNLYDLQARFNLNNIQDKKYHPFFLKLVANAPGQNANTSKALLQALLQWISPYQPGRGHDEFLDFYQKQKPAYYPGYQPMQSVSEFRLIKGVTAKLYQDLLPYITVLPAVTPININTAPKRLIMALGNGLTNSQTKELLEVRGDKGITNIKEISLLLSKLDIPNEQVTLKSQYFLSVATVSSQDLILINYTIIKLDKDRNDVVSSSLVHESLNTL